MTDPARPIFRICSGQGKRARRWGICLSHTYDRLAPWWRAENSKGRTRLFQYPESADAARIKLENEGWPANLTERGITP